MVGFQSVNTRFGARRPPNRLCGCYVVAPAQAGLHTSGRETYGDSLIVDYWGQVLSRLARGTGLITADINLASQAESRLRFPALDNRQLGVSGAAVPA